MTKDPKSLVRTVYLYLVSFIGLIIMVVGVIDLIDYLLELMLPDRTPTSNDYSYFGTLRSGIAYLVVGVPLWLYHWHTIRDDKHSAPDFHATKVSPTVNSEKDIE